MQLTLHELKSVDIEDKRKSSLYNNATFVLAEFGKNEEAEKLMTNLSSWVHKSATATATLGLIHLRKGRLESGKRLYKEAISLAVDPRMKSRLKKKMQLEVGKVLLEQGRLQAASRSLKEAAESELKGISAPAADFLKTMAR